MSQASAAPTGSDSPPPASFITPVLALFERVLGSVTPNDLLTFFWGLYFIYLALVVTWRAEYLVKRVVDQYVSKLVSVKLDADRHHSYVPPPNRNVEPLPGGNVEPLPKDDPMPPPRSQTFS